jgi:hypothetical protein
MQVKSNPKVASGLQQKLYEEDIFFGELDFPVSALNMSDNRALIRCLFANLSISETEEIGSG